MTHYRTRAAGGADFSSVVRPMRRLRATATERQGPWRSDGSEGHTYDFLRMLMAKERSSFGRIVCVPLDCSSCHVSPLLDDPDLDGSRRFRQVEGAGDLGEPGAAAVDFVCVSLDFESRPKVGDSFSCRAREGLDQPVTSTFGSSRRRCRQSCSDLFTFVHDGTP